MSDEEIERLRGALVLLKKIEDALSAHITYAPSSRWVPLYQEVADFLDSAYADSENT